MMKKGPRQTYFVCSAIKNNKLITEILEGESGDIVIKDFVLKYQIEPENLSGPFYKKKTGILDTQLNIKFTKKTIAGIYDDWYVNGVFLEEPADSIYIFFNSRVDGKKNVKPQPIVVKVNSIKV